MKLQRTFVFSSDGKDRLELEFLSRERDLVVYYRVYYNKDGVPDPDLCYGGVVSPPFSYSKPVKPFLGEDQVMGYAANILPLKVLGDPDSELDNRIPTIGTSPFSTMRIFFVNDMSPEPYRNVKEFIYELDEFVREIYPGYGVVYREGDPRDNDWHDALHQYVEKLKRES